MPSTDSRMKTTFWWISSGHGKKQCNWWCAACGGQYDWKAPNRILVIQSGTDFRDAKVFRAHAAPQGMCENLIDALKLLTNQQKDGDSPVKMVVQGLQERIRLRIMSGLRKFIMVDNHEEVKDGDLDKNVGSRKVVEPKSTTDFSGSCGSGRSG